MKEIARYLGLAMTLPAEERGARARRVLDRWIGRRPGLRRLVPSPSLRRVVRVDPAGLPARLRGLDPSRGPLHRDLAARAQRIAASRADDAARIVEHARTLLERRFDLLGTGPWQPLLPDGAIDWSLDGKSGKHFPLDAYHLDVAIVRGDGSDVKVPWELARFQHLLVLGQARLLAPDLAQRCAREAAEQIDHWIRVNPRGVGVHWTCAMEVAIRAVNWIAALAFFRDAPEWDDAFLLRLVRSLHDHGRHVRSNLEIAGDGLTSNHFLSDVLGLYVLGSALPELHDAAEWRSFGLQAIVESMERQVLPDGTDFERSLPYHRLVTEIFLHAALHARGRGDVLPPAFASRLERMLEFTLAAQRSSGTVPQWGDNDDGRVLPLDGYATHEPNDHRHLLAVGGELLGRADLAAAAGPRDLEALWLFDEIPAGAAPAEGATRAFPESEYFVMRSEDVHLAVPCGAVGTRGLGNHTHNDLFSLCVEARGIEWITDPGTGVYTSDPELRNLLRGTAAHATLQLGSREQNVLPPGLDGLFRVEERAKPTTLEWSADASGAVLRARHSGFSGPDGAWVHERSIRFDAATRRFTIDDRLEREPGGGPPTDPVFLRFPLGAGITALVADAGAVVVLRAGTAAMRIDLELPEGSVVSIESAPRSPRYGVVEEGLVVVAKIPPSTLVRARSTLLA